MTTFPCSLTIALTQPIVTRPVQLPFGQVKRIAPLLADGGHLWFESLRDLAPEWAEQVVAQCDESGISLDRLSVEPSGSVVVFHGPFEDAGLDPVPVEQVAAWAARFDRLAEHDLPLDLVVAYGREMETTISLSLVDQLIQAEPHWYGNIADWAKAAMKGMLTTLPRTSPSQAAFAQLVENHLDYHAVGVQMIQETDVVWLEVPDYEGGFIVSMM